MGNERGEKYEKPSDLPEGNTGKPGGATYSDNSGKFLINSAGLEMVKHFEGLYLKAYRDSVGVLTLAYGRIVHPDGRKIREGETCTVEEAEAWLLHDLYAEGAKYVRVFTADDRESKLSENEFSALVGFTFNRGAGRYRDYISGFINAGDNAGAMRSLCSVNWAGPDRKYLLGLDRRRWAERYLFEGKDWTQFKDIAWFKKFKERGYR